MRVVKFIVITLIGTIGITHGGRRKRGKARVAHGDTVDGITVGSNKVQNGYGMRYWLIV